MDHNATNMDEKLVQYLDGELSTSEQAAIENALANDAALKTALENLKMTRASIKLYGLQEQVKTVRKQMKEEQQVAKIIPMQRKIRRMAMGIAAAVLLVFGGYMTYHYFHMTPEKLFLAHYQPYEMTTNRAGQANTSAIVRDYKAKQFKEVIRIQPDSSFTATELFARAMSFIELHQSDSAIQSFQQLMVFNNQSGKPQFKDETEFYLALVYIRHKDFDKALDLLEKIKKDPSHLYYNKVTDSFLRKVKKLNR